LATVGGQLALAGTKKKPQFPTMTVAAGI